MAVAAEHMERVGSTFSKLYDDRDLERIRPLYHEDAVFISPSPPGIRPDFETTLVGRDEILRYLEATMETVPPGIMSTVALLIGIDMVVWVWQAPAVKGADVMMFDDDGLIIRHHVTAPRPD